MTRKNGRGKHRAWFTQQVFPGCDYSDDELELIKALDEYKRKTGVRFPSATDVMQVMLALGYRKVTTHGDDADSEQLHS